MTQSSIEWTDYTLNPGIYGCTEVSRACKNCYAAKMAHRQVAMGNYPAGITTTRASGVHWTGRVEVDCNRIGPAFATLPKRKRARVFVTSMGDLFHEAVPAAFISDVFREMAHRDHLTFQVLTKRPMRAVDWWLWWGSGSTTGGRWPPNVWMGATVENQVAAEQRIPHLLKIPAPVRFLSCEPLCGPVDLGLLGTLPKSLTGGAYEMGYDHIHWVIAGGESGPHAEPSHPDWFRGLRDQCVAAGVPFFFKQWGEWGPTGGGDGMAYRGKGYTGRLLDGYEWKQFPEVR